MKIILSNLEFSLHQSCPTLLFLTPGQFHDGLEADPRVEVGGLTGRGPGGLKGVTIVRILY